MQVNLPRCPKRGCTASNTIGNLDCRPGCGGSGGSDSEITNGTACRDGIRPCRQSLRTSSDCGCPTGRRACHTDREGNRKGTRCGSSNSIRGSAVSQVERCSSGYAAPVSQGAGIQINRK